MDAIQYPYFQATSYRGESAPYKVFDCRFLSSNDAMLFCAGEAQKPEVIFVALYEWQSFDVVNSVQTWKQFPCMTALTYIEAEETTS